MSEGRIRKVKITTGGTTIGGVVSSGGTTIQGATVPSSGTVVNEVFHDNTLKGTGQPSNELGIAESVLQDIASKVSDVQVNGESVVAEGVADITVGDATITIQKNGTDIDSFTANETTDKTINVEVPTTLRELSTVAEQRVLDSGITSADVEQITTNKNDIATANGEINTINSKIPSTASSENKLTDKDYVDGEISGVNSDIADINSKIPSDASSSNKLTDKDYVDGEISTLSGEISSLDGDITDINSKIPAQASAENKLADKNFVNSSIATNTANFIGTFDSVAELEAYSGTVTNNDYAFVVSEDSAGNTVYNRYKYTTATTPASWVFEYELNNSSFTADQWAAINSGATTTNIGQIATNTSTISGHIADKNNPHQVTKSQVGLGNCNNTSDADKPISTATQSALNLKANDADVVHKTGNETIDGIKTFSDAPFAPYIKLGPQSTDPTSAEGGEIVFVSGGGEPNAGKPTSIDRFNGTVRIFGEDSNGVSHTVLAASIQNNTLIGPTPTEDSTNSTQLDTVGARNTKLQNYSLDANVVHKTGNETIAGNKTFTNPTTVAYLTINPNNDSPTSKEGGEIHFVGASGEVNAGKAMFIDRFNGILRVFGSDSSGTVHVQLQADAEHNTLSGVTPTEDTTSSIQIDTVGARNTKLQNYTLDSNAVHKTGNETIGGEKTFSDTAVFNYNANFKSGMYLINTSYGLFDETASSKYFDFSDKNGKNSAWFENRINDSGIAGASRLNMWVRAYTDNTYSTTVDSVISLVAKPDGTKFATAPAPTANDMSSTQIDTVGARNTNIRDFTYKYITNCITEIPQDIKLELNSGTLTLKAGSKVYVPNGAGVFDAYTVPSDLTNTPSMFSTSTNRMYVLSPNKLLTPIDTGAEYVYSGTTAPTTFDGNGRAYWYDTTNNVIKRTADSGSTWVGGYSFPIAIVDITNGVGVSKIDQVFNGFGFIGSTVFALPGVKGLIPAGRNADGTLKNLTATVPEVRTASATNSDNKCVVLNNQGYIFIVNGNFESETKPSTNWAYWYKPSENVAYNTQSGTPSLVYQMSAISFVADAGGKITSFTPQTVFHAVDYNDYASTAEQVNTNTMNIATIGTSKANTSLDNVSAGIDFVVESQLPTAQNNYTWYRKYKSGWVEQGGYIATSSDVEKTIGLAVTMADIYYNVNIQREYTSSPGSTNANLTAMCVWGIATNQFKCWDKYGSSVGIRWEVKGMAA